ncbi:MAG TPA: S8 family peptidase [Solirubrobacterales bacterium]
MEASGEGGREGLDRPPLRKGEAYAGDIPFSKSRGPGDPWWPFETVASVARQQIQEIQEQAAQLTAEQIGRNGKVVVEATVLPNYLAASHYPADLLAETKLVPVGSRTATGTRKQPKQEDIPDQPAKTYLLAGDQEAVAKLGQVYEREPEREGLWRDALKFTAFSLSDPERVLGGTGELPEAVNGKYVYEAVLHPQFIQPGEPDPAAAQRVLEDFRAYLESLGAEADDRYTRFEGDMWHVPVLFPLDPSLIINAAKFAQLRVLRPMPRIRATPEPRDGYPGEITAGTLGVPQHPGRIAIFDGGTGTFVPEGPAWISVTDLTDRPPSPAPLEHGSAVTSAALFGNLESGGPLPQPHTPVDHFRVWPLPSDVPTDFELPWVLGQIEQVISTGDYRIAVITLAPALTVEDSEPHLWTAVLDRLAVEHDVLFVVAGGNQGELAAGLNRILVPADLMNGLSVGACTDPEGKVIRDDYSCVGPGRPGAMTAPTGVQFGGNLETKPFGAFNSVGGVIGDEGTSLSAPVVARGCAELNALLGGTGSANLLRALAVHLCERPSKKEAEDDGSSARSVGYGRFPTSFRHLLEQDASEVTIVYEGALKRRQRIELPVPIPNEIFEETPTKTFKFRWTLSFFTPVDPANPVDYSTNGIQVIFRPHIHKFMLTDQDEQSIGPFHEIDEAPQIEHMTKHEGYKKAEFPRSAEQTGVAPEVDLRHIHGKWEGLLRMDKGLHGQSLCRPRLDLHMLSREGGDLQKDAEDLTYALVVTIKGPSGVDMYDRTVAYASLLQPLVTDIPVLVGVGI